MNNPPGKPQDPTKPRQGTRSRAPLRVVRPRSKAGTAADRRPDPGVAAGAVHAGGFPASSWLSTTCRLLPGIRAAAIFETAGVDAPAVLAGWPASTSIADDFVSVAISAASRRRNVVLKGPAGERAGEPGAVEVIAYPLTAAGHPAKVVVVCTSGASAEGLRLVARHLKQCEAWLPLVAHAPAANQPGAERPLLEVMAQCLEPKSFRASAMAVSTHLATHLGCERVSIAMLHGSKPRLEAISRHGDFDHRAALSHSIVAAMEEAIDQDGVVRYPLPPEGPFRVVQAHEALCQQTGIAAVCTVPMSSQGELTGAVTFEHPDAGRFDPATVAFCEAAIGFVGPMLAARQRAERPLAHLLRDRVVEARTRLFGPRHVAAKLLATSAAILCLLAAFVNGDYRVKAQAVLRGTVQRMVVAPIDGFIAEAPVRAGDQVEAGQVLATLDRRALQLEQVKLASDRDRLRNEFRAAMAELDSIQVSVLRSQLDRATAEVRLVEEQLARIRIVAPFPGMVVSGDLSQAIGAPVKQGSTLFEVAPLDSYRVMLEVDERDIGDVAVGQQGRLVLAGFPGDRLGFVVERITPVSSVADGRNFFSVEASLLQTPPMLRPGMQGVAKLEVGPRRLGWIWGHRATHWLTLQAWRWLPLD